MLLSRAGLISYPSIANDHCRSRDANAWLDARSVYLPGCLNVEHVYLRRVRIGSGTRPDSLAIHATGVYLTEYRAACTRHTTGIFM